MYSCGMSEKITQHFSVFEVKMSQHFSVFEVKMTQHFSVFEVKMILAVYGSGLESLSVRVIALLR